MLKYFGLSLFLIATTLSATFGAPELLRNGHRIVGGKEANISKHPHQISMRRKGSSAFTHVCGGSIISDDAIVTAAHCVYNQRPENYMIVAGTNNRRGGDGAAALVREIIVHENYDPKLIDNDIAIMLLKTPLPTNNVTIAPIPLTTELPKHGVKCTITGWGTTSSGGYSSDKLLEVEVPIVGNEECDKDYATYYGPGRILDSMICAGVQGVGGKDACQGDSGGPLVVKNMLAGIVSWGRGCALPQFPGVYTNVFKYLGWVKDKIKENS